MKIKTQMLLLSMAASGLTACDYTRINAYKAGIADKNIYQINKLMPEYKNVVTVTYNFNDSTQTILSEFGTVGGDSGTSTSSRRGFDELKGTEKEQLDSIKQVRNRNMPSPR